jgi:hypothetical protein
MGFGNFPKTVVDIWFSSNKDMLNIRWDLNQYLLNWTITIYLSKNGERSKLLIPDFFSTSSFVWDVNEVNLKFTYTLQCCIIIFLVSFFSILKMGNESNLNHCEHCCLILDCKVENLVYALNIKLGICITSLKAHDVHCVHNCIILFKWIVLQVKGPNNYLNDNSPSIANIAYCKIWLVLKNYIFNFIFSYATLIVAYTMWKQQKGIYLYRNGEGYWSIKSISHKLSLLCSWNIL